MATDQSRPSTAASAEAPGKSRLSRLLGVTILVLLVVLLVEALLEAYVQVQLGPRHIVKLPTGFEKVVIDLPQWPKTLKSVLYLALLGLALAKVAVDRRWRSFASRADIALVAVAVVMVLAGLVEGSPLLLIGKAIFVYLRGVIVFYAWRAANPPWSRVKPALWVVGTIVVINCVIAAVNTVLGYDSYVWLHWVDYTWAKLNRAHALFDHPNHLGHVTAIMLLGLAAWFVTKTKVGAGWWFLYCFVALGMSATQSRESLIGVLCGLGLIWFLRRGQPKVLIASILVIVALTGLQLAVSPEHRNDLVQRLAGVMAALHLPSGAEAPGSCVEGNVGCTQEDAIPRREVRLLYAQQAADLWAKSPVVGYGVGQFGGIVAYMDDPKWYEDERFGPHGFNMHGFNDGKQVDSFWMHLVIETGTLGLLVYIAWMILIGLPFWRARLRRPKGGVTPRGLTSAEGVHPIMYWAPAVLLFGMLVAGLSTSLEDPILPPLMFSVLGAGWVVLQRGDIAGMTPAEGLDAPAVLADLPAAERTSAPPRETAPAGADAAGRGAYGPGDRDS